MTGALSKGRCKTMYVKFGAFCKFWVVYIAPHTISHMTQTAICSNFMTHIYIFMMRTADLMPNSKTTYVHLTFELVVFHKEILNSNCWPLFLKSQNISETTAIFFLCSTCKNFDLSCSPRGVAGIPLGLESQKITAFGNLTEHFDTGAGTFMRCSQKFQKKLYI